MRIKEIITEAINYTEYARQTAEKFGVPFSLVYHAMHKETGHLRDPAARAQAVSRAGARGVMQLMPDTAKALGVQDITNPAQNIEAGVKYLGQLYNKFGDPIKALAAYNAGPGKLNRLINKYGDDYIKKLPRETRNYVADYSDSIDKMQRPDPLNVPPSKHPYRDMATTALAAVTGSKDAIAADKPPRAIPPTPPSAPPVITPAPTAVPDYTIKKGQTLSSIAKQHGTTIDQIMSLNPNIKDPNKIVAGSSLKLK